MSEDVACGVEFDDRVELLLSTVDPDHREAFKWLFELGKGILDQKGAEHMGLITALAVRESMNRRVEKARVGSVGVGKGAKGKIII